MGWTWQQVKDLGEDSFPLQCLLQVRLPHLIPLQARPGETQTHGSLAPGLTWAGVICYLTLQPHSLVV